jgi:hypothetical protein
VPFLSLSPDLYFPPLLPPSFPPSPLHSLNFYIYHTPDQHTLASQTHNNLTLSTVYQVKRTISKPDLVETIVNYDTEKLAGESLEDCIRQQSDE